MMIEFDPTELGAQVIELRPKKAALDQGLTVVRGASRCEHAAIELDDNLRAVTCRTCKAHLDAFATLLEFARKWDRFRGDREQCLSEIKGAQSRIDLLERTERNARARAKRMFDHVPTKQEMHDLLDGNIWMWTRDNRVEIAFNRKSLTPAQAREIARGLLKFAREAEKPVKIDPETGEQL